MPRSHTTIRDVAAQAGVSHQTVSRVINQDPRVLPATRLKVEQAIQELGYSPNAIARIMAIGVTHTLACISPNLTDYTFASLIEAAEIQAYQQGYYVIAASAKDLATFQNLVLRLIDSRRVDGLIVINPYIDQRYRHLPQDVPMVFLGAEARHQEANAVVLDEVAAGSQAVSYLLDLGHTWVAHICGPANEDCTRGRLQGYLQAHQARGLEPNPSLILEGDWSASSGFDAMQSLLKGEQPFSAVFAQNDRMAVGAIRALQQAGLRVPQDVSVLGFDDMPLASYFDPPLTTIRQDFNSMGSQAVQVLIDAIENPTRDRRTIKLPVQVIARASTSAQTESLQIFQ